MNKHSGEYFIKEAKKNGLETQNGKGDHVKIIGPAGRGYMTVPRHAELAKGTECAIRKWFKLCGIILGVLAAMAVVLTAVALVA